MDKKRIRYITTIFALDRIKQFFQYAYGIMIITKEVIATLKRKERYEYSKQNNIQFKKYCV